MTPMHRVLHRVSRGTLYVNSAHMMLGHEEIRALE